MHVTRAPESTPSVTRPAPRAPGPTGRRPGRSRSGAPGRPWKSAGSRRSLGCCCRPLGRLRATPLLPPFAQQLGAALQGAPGLMGQEVISGVIPAGAPTPRASARAAEAVRKSAMRVSVVPMRSLAPSVSTLGGPSLFGIDRVRVRRCVLFVLASGASAGASGIVFRDNVSTDGRGQARPLPVQPDGK